MKLLITTQAVDLDDPVLGFFHSWIAEFAKHYERVMVICLREGRHNLPDNVEVYSLGKEKGSVSRMQYASRFLYLLYKLGDTYDAVFVHMNPEYLVLGGLWWRIHRKKTALWYVHKSVDMKLRIAAFFVNVIFTVSQGSIRLKNKKVRFVGHGIDTSRFAEKTKHRQTGNIVSLITVGRLSPSKRVAEMFPVLRELNHRGVSFRFTIVGAPATAQDSLYEEQLKKLAEQETFADSIQFMGPVSHEDIPSLLQSHDVFLNLSTTGGVDKAVLEAVAAGVVPVTSNEAFRTLLEPYGLFIEDDKPEVIADTILWAQKANIHGLMSEVQQKHSLQNLIPIILQSLS